MSDNVTYESYVIYEWVMSHSGVLKRRQASAREHNPEIHMSHVTHKWVTSRMHELWYFWMSHFSYGWVTSHVTGCRLMNESCHLRMSYVTHAWVTSRMNESCQIRMGHVTCDWVQAYEWVLSTSDELCHSCRVWMSRVKYERVSSRMSYVTHAAYECFSWWVLQHCTGFARLVWDRLRVHRAFVYSDWFVCYVCVLCHSCRVWMSRVKYERVSSRMTACTRLCTEADPTEWVMSFMNESCHAWITHVTNEWVMTLVNDSCHTYECVMSHIWMSHVTYKWVMSHRMSSVTYERVMSLMNASRHVWMRAGDFSKMANPTEWVMSPMNE